MSISVHVILRQICHLPFFSQIGEEEVHKKLLTEFATIAKN